MKDQQSLGFGKQEKTGPVQCLGMTFQSEEARRAHFLGLLADKLRDPEFRETPGFPKASDEDILRLSDPPYYTACPNPFLADLVRMWGRLPAGQQAQENARQDAGSTQEYRREPFAVDVSVGKTDQLYRAHGYHTKVPHLAIVPSILHYTQPGDIVLDGFCGSGMTGVAAQWCGTAPKAYRRKLEEDWKKSGRQDAGPTWGARRVVLGDLGPAATFIAANYNIPFDVEAFAEAAQRILDQVEAELGWMYATLARGVQGSGFRVQGSDDREVQELAERIRNAQTTDELRRLLSQPRTQNPEPGTVDFAFGKINYTVWSEVFSCPECAGEVVFIQEALDPETKRVRAEFPCPRCQAALSKKKLDRLYETRFDAAIGETVKAPKRKPALINYTVGKTKYEKPLDEQDWAILERIEAMPLPAEVPVEKLPYMHMTHERARMDHSGVTHLHHFFLPRAAQALAALWRKASAEPDSRLRNMLLFFVEQAIWGMSVLNRYKPIQFGRPGGSQVNNYMSGVYYIASAFSDCNPRYVLEGKLKRLNRVYSRPNAINALAVVTTGDCAHLPIPADSIDYIFTDPPFGENIYYADLNFLVESWHRVLTNAEPEAIVDRAKKKGLLDYQDLMRGAFAEYHRVLKPGRWMTVVFSNSRNSVWRSIQEAMGTAGFVVADVRTLDKKQGSYRQVTSSAVKQDLVISAYKPTEALAHEFELGHVSPDSAWVFVREHLKNVPIFVAPASSRRSSGEDKKGRLEAGPTNLEPSTLNLRLEVVAERTPQMLLDRMIAFHVQRGLSVPLSAPEFLQGLARRFPERDGMYFLPNQVNQYERKRMSVSELRQISLFVNDEASAIQWLRQQLHDKPQSFQDLQPRFMREIKSWARHEATVELKVILEQSFLHYDGKGPVPSQIHRYLSSNFKDLRKLDKENPRLQDKARDRWYVPDPNKQADIEKLRSLALLKEFQEYETTKQRRLKVFRTEAVRAGFKAAWQDRDYTTIVEVAEKLPPKVLQEDATMLMYYDNALTRLEG